MGEDARYFWLSFADADKPPGSQFLGVAIVKASSIYAAIREAWRQRCNPGGEVRSLDLSEGAKHDGIEGFHIPADYMNRLLTRDEALALDAWIGSTFKTSHRVQA